MPGHSILGMKKPNSPTRLLAATLAFKILNKFGLEWHKEGFRRLMKSGPNNWPFVSLVTNIWVALIENNQHRKGRCQMMSPWLASKRVSPATDQHCIRWWQWQQLKLQRGWSLLTASHPSSTHSISFPHSAFFLCFYKFYKILQNIIPVQVASKQDSYITSPCNHCSHLSLLSY